MFAEQSSQSERISILVSFVLVSAMLVCLVISFVQLGELVILGWHGGYLIPLGFGVALFSMYSARAARRLSFPEGEWWLYYLTGWVVILVALKLAYYTANGFALLPGDLVLWGDDFARYFFNSEYFFGIFVLFIVWLFAYFFSLDLLALEVDAWELSIERESGISEPRTQMRDRLSGMVLGIGIMITVMAAMLRYEKMAAWFNLPEMRGGVSNLLIYFLLGLALLSLTQYNMLRISWIMDKLAIRPEVARSWIGYSGMFIALVAFMAWLLPTSYSMGFFDTMNYLAMLGTWLVTLIIGILVTPIFLLLGFLSQLFGGGNEGSAPLPEPPSLPAPVNAVQQTGAFPWVELLKSAAFWLAFLLVVGFSLYYFLRENQALLDIFRRLPFFSALKRFWDWLRVTWGGASRQLSQSLGEGWQRLRQRFSHPAAQQSWQYVNLRRLSPRQQVLFYYLALVRRGGEQGAPRNPAQTPYEYSQTLLETFSSIGEPPAQTEGAPQDISALTERFMEARYSQHPVTGREASLARRYWEHIRRFLRRVRE